MSHHRPSFSSRTLKALKITGAALVGAQAAALIGVHIVDKLRKDRVPRVAGGFPTLPPLDTEVDGTEVRTYTEGTSLYEDMLEAITSAKDYIFFESYIWRSDAWGKRFKSALLAAAQRGVDVHIVYDGFAVMNQDPFFYVFPKTPHLYIRRFPEIRSGMFTFNLRKTGRDHRKIMVVDDRVAFVGGYNIGDPFALEWRDTHVRVTGEAVAELKYGFIDFWNHFKRRGQPKLPRSRAPRWTSDVSLAFNQPSRLLYPVRGLYIDAIDRAQHSIRITSAYFIPDREIFESLVHAARRGVRVQILIPEYSNHILADWVARPYHGPLLKEGVEIWLYQDAMIHSKTMTIDGVWSTVGTANIDRLSLQGNYEVNVQFRSQAFAATMDRIFELDLTNARKLTFEEWEERSLLTRISERLLHPFEFIV